MNTKFNTVLFCTTCLLTYACYHNILDAPFIFDDLLITKNYNIRSLWPIWQIFEIPHVAKNFPIRPFVTFTLALNYAVGEVNPFGYHLVNLLVHALASFTLYLVISLTFKAPYFSDRNLKSHRYLAASISLLWLVHPLNTESVTYTIQRAQAMMGLFYLLTLYFSIRLFHKKDRRWLILAIGSCWLGSLCKAIIVTVPAIVILYDRIFLYSSLRECFSKRKFLYLGLFSSWIIIGICLHKHHVNFEHDVGVSPPLQYLFTQFEVIVHYMSLALWPQNLNLDYGWPLVDSFRDVILHFLFITILIFFFVFMRQKSLGLFFIGSWFFITISATSSVVSLPDPACERYMYLPLIAVISFFVISINYLLDKYLSAYGTNKIIKITLFIISLTAFSWRTYLRNCDYETPIKMWNRVIEQNPRRARAHVNLANSYIRNKEYEKASHHINLALEINPLSPHLYLNHGIIYLHNEQYDFAKKNFNLCLLMDPEMTSAYLELGKVHREEKEYEKALAYFRKALALEPKSPQFHREIGFTLTKISSYDEALLHFHEANRIVPQDADIFINIGNCYGEIGREDKAMLSYRKALEIEPNNPLAYFNMACGFEKNQSYKKAIEYYQKAIEHKPDYLKAHSYLTDIYNRIGKYDLARKHREEVQKIKANE